MAAGGLLASCVPEHPPGDPAGSPGDPSQPAGGTPGPRQTAVLAAEPPAHVEVAALDLTVSGADAVAAALRGLADAAGLAAPGATVLVGLGASVFDRAGLARQKPRQLTTMPAFPGDLLDPARSHGDLLIEVGAADRSTVAATLDRMVVGHRVRWRLAGFRERPRVEQGHTIADNPFGFAEGYGNPVASAVPAVTRVTSHQGEPDWAVGGSYQVVRVIQLAIAFWAREPRDEQERIIGRRRDGSWPDGTAATDERAARTGSAAPAGSHVRRARSANGASPPLLRRAFTYRVGSAGGGPDEEGLLFGAYQRNLAAGFVAAQHRLAGEDLSRYTLTVGGGYFFVPPAGPPGSWWGAGLFGP